MPEPDPVPINEDDEVDPFEVGQSTSTPGAAPGRPIPSAPAPPDDQTPGEEA